MKNDTEMSLRIARAVINAGGCDLNGIADQFFAWMKNRPVDIGLTVRKGIRNCMLRGELKVLENEWYGCTGGVMRMGPVALLGADLVVLHNLIRELDLIESGAN